ncbi:MAG: hypothetical protein ACRD0K_15390 [Egibacteraceae bacterium]
MAPSLIGASAQVRHRLGETVVRIISAAGLIAAEHERAVTGAGRTVRTPDQRAALAEAVMAAAARAFGGRRCRRKTHRPPGADAEAAAAQLRAFDPADCDWDDEIAVDLDVYARAVHDPCGCSGLWTPAHVTRGGGDGR